MKRSLAAYGIALAVAYGAAYATWKRADETKLADQEVVILPGGLDDLESIDYTSKTLDLSIAVKTDALGRYLWVNATPKAEPKSADESKADSKQEPPMDPHGDPHANPAAAAPAETPVEPPSAFKAGKAADALMNGLAPFVAKRTLEGVAAEDLEQLGFGDDAATITLNRKGKAPKRFVLGESVYGGASFYVKDPESAKIFVVDAAIIRPLLNATRSLPDTALVEATLKDITRVDVQAGETRQTFEQHNPDDAQAQFWSRAGSAEADPAAGAWLDKALRLRSAEYVDASKVPAAMEDAFSFVVHGKDQTVRVAVHRAFDDEGEEQWFAQSEHTRGLVKLHPSMAAEATADLSSALGAEAPLSPAKPAASPAEGATPAAPPAQGSPPAASPVPSPAPMGAVAPTPSPEGSAPPTSAAAKPPAPTPSAPASSSPGGSAPPTSASAKPPAPAAAGAG